MGPPNTLGYTCEEFVRQAPKSRWSRFDWKSRNKISIIVFFSNKNVGFFEKIQRSNRDFSKIQRWKIQRSNRDQNLGAKNPTVKLGYRSDCLILWSESIHYHIRIKQWLYSFYVTQFSISMIRKFSLQAYMTIFSGACGELNNDIAWMDACEWFTHWEN